MKVVSGKSSLSVFSKKNTTPPPTNKCLALSKIRSRWHTYKSIVFKDVVEIIIPSNTVSSTMDEWFSFPLASSIAYSMEAVLVSLERIFLYKAGSAGKVWVGSNPKNKSFGLIERLVPNDPSIKVTDLQFDNIAVAVAATMPSNF